MLERFHFKRIALTILIIITWLVVVIYGAFYGWWMRPIAEPGDTSAFFQQAVSRLEEENAAGNSALVLIEDGAITFEYYSSQNDTIDADTIFSTASLSKWIAASAVMSLVQEGKLRLDDPVSQHLTRWQLPPSEFDNAAVTVRRLLSHTAGLSDGLGFGDYTADETLPTLEESLSNPRASSGLNVEISVQAQPGSKWQYSGASYLILELLIEEVSGMSFEDYVQQAIFDPLNMQRSSYEYLGKLENTAGSYAATGERAPNYQYASSAATAFATSPSDLATFVLSQIPGSGTPELLTPSTIASMKEPHGRVSGADVWGLGTMLYAPTPQGDTVFGHDGGNDPAINSVARINPSTGDAIVVLETGHPALATAIGSQWILWQTGYPDILDTGSVLASMMLPAVVGILLILLALFLLVAARNKNRRQTDAN